MCFSMQSMRKNEFQASRLGGARFIQPLAICFAYIIYTQALNLRLKMQETYNQVQNPMKFLNMLYSLPFLGNFSLPLLFPHSFNNKIDYDQNSTLSNRGLLESSFNEQYESRTKENIILKSKPTKMIKKAKVTKISDTEEQTTKVPRKCTQKETRNINSNLLRIFLKNLIELRVYTDKIRLISTQINANLSPDQFYLWIQGFAINFKNYIRSKQVSKVISHHQPLRFRKVFLILLNHYSREIGLMHCLTSKRIERNSIKIHLEGLRSLSKDLQNVASTKK